MNRNFRVITINGIRGIIAAVFVICGLIAGFVISPGWVCMKLWNHTFEYSSYSVVMNLFQGIILWAIIALSLYALNNRRMLIGFGSYPALNPEQLKNIMERSKQTEEKIIKELKEAQFSSDKTISEEENETKEEVKQ